ncbi:MAG: hypothetical protein C4K48_06400 [Candidatus Thorarchaeota archaeon]|nr:MAG: hypothetical protein C4K48_06400 [Candidatus Thorarchaeota archaeon]
MDATGKNHVYIDSLSAMKRSLENSYELNAAVQDETMLLQGLGQKSRDYVTFAGYLRNDGRRRFKDITEIINHAVDEIEGCDSARASAIYLQTLRAVRLQSRWAKILELYSKQ